MTVCTGKIVVFAPVRLKQGHGFSMTSAAVMGWYIIRIGNH
jgi:hypothetical protein